MEYSRTCGSSRRSSVMCLVGSAAAVFVTLGVTQGPFVGLACVVIFLVYQNLENHVIQPLIVGRAVDLSPPVTMVAALVGVSAGGLIGGLFAIPLLGATKAIYLSTREQREPQTE